MTTPAAFFRPTHAPLVGFGTLLLLAAACGGTGGSDKTGGSGGGTATGTTSTTSNGVTTGAGPSTTSTGTTAATTGASTTSASSTSSTSGSSTSGSSSTTGTTTSSSTGSSSGGASCASLPLCDDFEATAAGAAPNSALWTLIPNQLTNSDTVTVDTIGAHGSSHSLKVVSNDRVYVRNSTVIGTLGSVVHVRYYARFAAALSANHGAMIVTHPMPVDQYSQSNELRFGSQDSVFHWNNDSDAANIPDVSPSGDALSVKPAANTWYCIELTINTNGHLAVSIDGQDVPGLAEDGTPTPNVDQAWIASGTTSLSRYSMLADFNFGWASYGAGPLTVWYDDVALSPNPIGCQQ